ncbi:endonuclease/exonuclease/phosphatase family protein [Haladaptatus sp. CMSO5]|uniref:endonuclease/exonuclease/phosphatase family protein n=1 Tax=Haladaptatus sp. CMSO5 TaxID=3120514 RepID=UPI002FCE5083
MKILSWNVNGTFPPQGSTQQIEEQTEWLATLDELPDVLLLQEVNPNQQERWHESVLDVLGYADLVDTLQLARDLDNSNGHLTAVSDGWHLSRTDVTGHTEDNVPPNEKEMEYPEKILVSEIEDATTGAAFECWNIRAVPGGSYPEEKIKILECAYDRIEADGQKPRILAGDLNTPNRELPDGQVVTFGYERSAALQRRAVSAELNILKGLGHFGMLDVFRSLHGYGSLDQLDKSHDDRRIDHLFATEALDPIECWYSAAGAEYSDHAPLIARFGV